MTEEARPPREPEPEEPLIIRRPPRTPWPIIGVAAAAAVGAGWLYLGTEQRGLTVESPGHVLVLPAERGGAWALMLEGGLVRIEAESVARFALKTGPCEQLAGTLEGEQLRLDAATCTAGPLQKQIGERLKRKGLKFAYWDPGIPFAGETLEPHLQTPEIFAAMTDARDIPPQLVPLYNAFFPRTLAEARQAGVLPEPLVLHMRRDDLQLVRLTRPELAQLLDRPSIVVAGGAAAGGWLVRRVTIDPAAEGSLESLLVNPLAAPWPLALKGSDVRARRATPPPEPPPSPAPAASP